VQDRPQQHQQLLLHRNPAGEVQDSAKPSQQLWSAHGDPADGHRCFTDSGMQIMCKLTKLQYLELGSLQGVTTAGLAGFHKLRQLKSLTLWQLACDISLSARPTFSQLTALTTFVLSWVHDPPYCEFDPSILAHMAQLEDVAILSCTQAHGAAGVAELLSRLSQLPQLRMLEIRDIEGLEQCPPEAFSSLTSSNKMESLAWGSFTPLW